MRNFIVTAAVVGALSAMGLGLAGAAAAVAMGSSSMTDTVSIPRQEGFDTASDDSIGSPLARCTISEVHGLPVIDAGGNRNAAGIVLVDFDCVP